MVVSLLNWFYVFVFVNVRADDEPDFGSGPKHGPVLLQLVKAPCLSIPLNYASIGPSSVCDSDALAGADKPKKRKQQASLLGSPGVTPPGFGVRRVGRPPAALKESMPLSETEVVALEGLYEQIEAQQARADALMVKLARESDELGLGSGTTIASVGSAASLLR
jgi:hypothetical protein